MTARRRCTGRLHPHRTEGATMNKVVMHNVVSVDGFIADEHDDIGPLFDWYFNGDTNPVQDSSFQMSATSASYVRDAWASIGAMVIGRRLFDLMNGWAG